MKTNTIIRKYQNEIVNILNRAGNELPPVVIQLILQNVMYQVNAQVNAAIQNESTLPTEGDGVEYDTPSGVQ